jgi:hypothetical protein
MLMKLNFRFIVFLFPRLAVISKSRDKHANMWLPFAIFLALVIPVLGNTHYFFSGFFAGSTIIGVEFDDGTSSLSIVNNITTSATGSKWIAIDVRLPLSFPKHGVGYSNYVTRNPSRIYMLPLRVLSKAMRLTKP